VVLSLTSNHALIFCSFYSLIKTSTKIGQCRQCPYSRDISFVILSCTRRELRFVADGNKDNDKWVYWLFSIYFCSRMAESRGLVADKFRLPLFPASAT